MAVVNVIVNGPVGSGKSALMLEILVALKAIGVNAEVVGQNRSDVDGDPSRALDIYREGLKVIIAEDTVPSSVIEERIGGAYEMPDGRQFWLDNATAREITRRVQGWRPSSNERLEASS